MKPDQIDILTFAVFCCFEQIDYSEKTRLSCQFWSDIEEADRLDRIYLDFPFFHFVPVPYFDVRARPDADAAGDLSATNSFAKTLDEHHQESLHQFIRVAICFVGTCG